MITEIVKVNQTHIRLDLLPEDHDLFDLNEDEVTLIKGASILRNGGLVAFPTETVYGIGANALNVDSVKKIFLAKGRPNDNPLIVHIGQEEDLNLYTKEVPDYAHTLIQHFWPGPLTLIFNKQPIIPDDITGGLDTVAIRMPKNPIALKLIRLAKCPIAAPSANISGKPSPTRGYHVVADLDGKVDMIIDGGSADIGLESTVLDVTHEIPIILRPGSVTKEMLESVVGRVDVDLHLSSHEEAPKSPGMKYKHYAPKGQLIVYRGPAEKVVEAINEQVGIQRTAGKKVGVISTSDYKDLYECDQVLDIGSRPDQIAANLFKMLRRMDDLEVEIIYIRSIDDEAIGFATMNRLMKAAGHYVIEV